MISTLARTGFGIKISYGRESKPEVIFRALSEMLIAFQSLDRHLLESVDVKFTPIILLEDLEKGSLIAWLTTVLEKLEDKDVINLKFDKIVGTFLNQARYAVINFTKKGNKLESKEQIEELQQDLVKIAESSNIKELPIYSFINPRDLLSDVTNIQNSLTELSDEDNVSYLTSDMEVSFNKSFSFTNEIVEEILTKEIIESQSIMILKVKKPDYLGDSKWEFEYENRKLEEKIKNSKWLSDYQQGKIDIRPGSSLRASIHTIVKYDYDNEVISSQYEILEVLEIIPPTTYIQAELS